MVAGYRDGVHPYLDVLTALDAAGVRYVVVGGVAVTLQGHMRATVDLDLVIDLLTENVSTAVEALQGLGLVPRLPVPASSLADEATRREWVEERNLTVFSMHDPLDPRREVDLFADPPIDPVELLARADRMRLGTLSVPVASRGDLIAMKRLAGRPQDLADVAALEALDG